MSTWMPIGNVLYDRFQNNVIWSRPGHSGEHPNLYINKRRLQSNGRSTYVLKGVLSDGSTDPSVPSENTIVELTIRNVRNQTDADVKALIAEIGAICADVDFQDDAVVSLELPNEANAS